MNKDQVKEAMVLAVDSCWPGLGSVLRVNVCPCLNTVSDNLLESARGCPGSTCISPVWLGRCNTLSLPMQYFIAIKSKPSLNVYVEPPQGSCLVKTAVSGMKLSSS